MSDATQPSRFSPRMRHSAHANTVKAITSNPPRITNNQFSKP